MKVPLGQEALCGVEGPEAHVMWYKGASVLHMCGLQRK